MPDLGGFRLDLDAVAIADLADSPDAEKLLQELGDHVAEKARQLAPKRTGAGAASIHAEVFHEDGGTVARVSYDRKHSYMGLQETGTEKMSPNPFLRPALDSTQI